MSAAPLKPGVELGEGVEVAPTAVIHPSTRGNRLVIGSGSEIYDQVVIRFVGGSGDIVMGKFCYINPGCVLYSGNGIRFGDYVLLAPGVKVMPTNHAFTSRDTPIRHQGFMPSRGGIVIEDDVWVGANAVLLDGAQIGRGAIIAAGAVVSGGVPAFEIWGGVPARKIRDRPPGVNSDGPETAGC
jgi:acetyltransferase-like isoleucine patch superfamily enzyme